MIRMTGIDASFLYMEAPNSPMHTLKLGILDLAGARGPKVDLEEGLVKTIEYFRTKI